jgi:outer membrane protein
MTKNAIRTLFVAFAMSLAAPLAHAQLKVGIIDMNQVFTEYYKTKDAEAKLNESRAGSKKELDDRLADVQRRLEAVNQLNAQAEKPELSNDARTQVVKDREEKLSELRNIDRETQEFRASREKQLQEQFLRMRKDIVEDIMKVVNEQVKAAGYDLVLDKSGLSMGQVPVVTYSRGDMDFSKTIVEKLNAAAPKTKPAN